MPDLIRPLLAVLALALPAQGAEVTVFAASSLKTALDAVAADWQAQTGNTVVIAYDGSAKLARQIEQGAPADVFISAAENWMDVVQDAGLIRPETRRDVLGNSLILIAAGQGATAVQIDQGLDLAGLLGQGKLAMGGIPAVPAGQYGFEALQSLGLWDSVSAQVVQSDSARATLALVATAEAAYGIVFASDANASAQVSVVGTFPAASHSLIRYPAAVLASSEKPEALAFVDALSSDAAAAVFAAQGFEVLK